MGSPNNTADLEKSLPARVTPSSETSAGSVEETHTSVLRRLAGFGVELRGILPVTLEERTDTKALNVFSFWWTVSLGLLP